VSVSRDAALRALRGALDEAAHGVAALVGPSGPTRGFVLQALVEELGPRFPAASLRRPTLPPGGLWMEIAARLDLDGGYDAKRRILRLAGELSGQGRGILVVIDGADALPGESLYGLLETAKSELGFYLVLGWPSEGAAQALPEGLFVARLDGTAVIPAPAFLAAIGGGAKEASPAETPRATGGAPLPAPAAAASSAPAPSATFAPRRAEPIPPRNAEPLVPTGPLPPSFAAPSDELPIRLRTARAPGSLHRSVWVASGLAIGLVVGVLAGSGFWRGIAAPDSEGPLASANDPNALYAPASEEPQPFDAAAAAQRAERAAAERRAAEAAAKPAPGPPAPAPTDVARPAEPAPAPVPATDVAAAPAPTPDVSAPPPSAPAPEAPPLEPRDLVPAPAAAPEPAHAARREPEPRPGPLAEGRLTIRSESPVMVEVDGKPFGPAPVTGLTLSRGEHRIMAHYDDGSVAMKTIYLASDDVSVSFR
jgi:hypothetical protein